MCRYNLCIQIVLIHFVHESKILLKVLLAIFLLSLLSHCPPSPLGGASLAGHCPLQSHAANNQGTTDHSHLCHPPGYAPWVAREEKTFRGFLAQLLFAISSFVVPRFFGRNIQPYSNKQRTVYSCCVYYIFSSTLTNLTNYFWYLTHVIAFKYSGWFINFVDICFPA